MNRDYYYYKDYNNPTVVIVATIKLLIAQLAGCRSNNLTVVCRATNRLFNTQPASCRCIVGGREIADFSTKSADENYLVMACVFNKRLGK